MPEVSQDVFELTNPLENPITADVLRLRANSNTKNKPQLPCDVILNRLSSHEQDLESFTGGMPSVENRWVDDRELSHRY